MIIEYAEAKEILRKNLEASGIVFTNYNNLEGEYFSLSINSHCRFGCYNYDKITICIKQQPYCFGKKDIYRRCQNFDIIHGDYNILLAKINECIKIGKKYSQCQLEQEKSEKKDEQKLQKWLKENKIKDKRITLGKLDFDIYGLDDISVKFYGDLNDLKELIKKFYNNDKK